MAIAADRALVAVPLGLLRAGLPTLDPLPPHDQQLAIGRLGYGAGVLGKIYLRFPYRFWPEHPKWFGRLPDGPDKRGTFNTFVSHMDETGLPILLSFSNGATAARLDRSASDAEVAEVAMRSLRKMFGPDIPAPEAIAFPRWLSDPWSQGGYSYPGVGSATEDRHIHARPLGNRVYFAGEATEPVEYGTVHAALWSAEQSAEALFAACDGRCGGPGGPALVRRAAWRGSAQWRIRGHELRKHPFHPGHHLGLGHGRRAVCRPDHHGAWSGRQSRTGQDQQQADVVAGAPADADAGAGPAVVSGEPRLTSMVTLTRIYTRGGDKGLTSLGRGERVAKHDPRVEAYGTVDEANSVIGMARSVIARTTRKDRRRAEVEAMLARIQNDLFDLGADLCTIMGKTKKDQPALRIVASQVERLEHEIDAMNGVLKPLTSFILPGGSEAAAHLHLARTVARRAERCMTALASRQAVNPEAIKYVNRLSDHLFVLARRLNGNGAADVLWVPGGAR